MESNFYPIIKLSNFMLYDNVDKDICYRVINGVNCVDLNKCKSYMKYENNF